MTTPSSSTSARIAGRSVRSWASLRPWAGSRWSFLAAVTFYTRNGAFFNGHKRDQAPLYSGQLNVIYTFRSGIWGAVGGTVYGGGRNTVDGKPATEFEENYRLGGTLVFPVSRHNSLKLWGSSGLYARTGGNFHILGASWVYAWAAARHPCTT
jgi:hypothetical protein